LQYGYIAESFETSVPWSRALPLCAAVKQTILDAAKANGVVRAPFVSCRITQLYGIDIFV
jgi:alkyldihydroxyacetonephosphate synthase